jgi:hypothetical protein
MDSSLPPGKGKGAAAAAIAAALQAATLLLGERSAQCSLDTGALPSYPICPNPSELACSVIEASLGGAIRNLGAMWVPATKGFCSTAPGVIVPT